MADTKKALTIEASIKDEALRIVEREKTLWEDAVCFVTDRVGFKMREMIRTLRKNYWGVYDDPIDKNTGREKLWIHLGMATIEDIVKSIDISQKDANFRASNPKGYALTDLTRQVVRDYLAKMFFGEILDETERQVCIDGTVVWKTWKSKNGKKVVMNRKTVDLLHIYIDPTEENIQSAYRITERGLMNPSELERMDGWTDTEKVKGIVGLDKNDSRSNQRTIQTAKFQDVWELWGKIPKWFITKDKKDRQSGEEVDGHIVVSGIESGDRRVHLIEVNKNKDKMGNILKPYEELRYAKVSGRWYGLGPLERILALIEYENMVVNTRLNRSLINQLGLMKVRKGSGITPAMLSRLPVNGAIPVNDMQDIEALEIPPVDSNSYNDENVIKEWATKITSAYPNAVGEPTPASTSATATALQNTNSMKTFTMVKSAIGSFLERWMDRHALPIIAETIDIGTMVRFSQDDESYAKLVERIITEEAENELEAAKKAGFVPSPIKLQSEIARLEQKMKNSPELFVEVADKLIAEHVDTVFYVTNEDLDVGVTTQNLLQLMQIAPQFQNEVVPMIIDFMGLPPMRAPQAPAAPQQPQGPQAPQGQPMPQNPPTQQGVVTGANTMQG